MTRLPIDEYASKDAFGDRMKRYEVVETGRRFMPGLPIYVRMDGRGFSRFTKGMDKPFDQRMTSAMQAATKTLVAKTNATLGYCQSDEISLVYMPKDAGSEQFFGGKMQKTVSVLAGLTTAAFTAALAQEFQEWARATDRPILGAGTEFLDRLPHFDARAFQVPQPYEAANAVLWRVKDAERNAVQMVAQSLYSQKKLDKQPTSKLRVMIGDKGIDFNLYPTSMRQGTFFQRVSTTTATPSHILEKMSEIARHKHATITRTSIQEIVPDGRPTYRFIADILGIADVPAD